MQRQLISEFGFELLQSALIVGFTASGEYLLASVAALMCVASALAEELAWRRMLRGVETKLDRRIAAAAERTPGTDRHHAATRKNQEMLRLVGI